MGRQLNFGQVAPLLARVVIAFAVLGSLDTFTRVKSEFQRRRHEVQGLEIRSLSRRALESSVEVLTHPSVFQAWFSRGVELWGGLGLGSSLPSMRNPSRQCP